VGGSGCALGCLLRTSFTKVFEHIGEFGIGHQLGRFNEDAPVVENQFATTTCAEAGKLASPAAFQSAWRPHLEQ
jgi:hypothetical protein